MHCKKKEIIKIRTHDREDNKVTKIMYKIVIFNTYRMSSSYKSFKTEAEANAWFEKRRESDKKKYGIQWLEHLKDMNYEYNLGMAKVAVQKLYVRPRKAEGEAILRYN